MYKLIDYHGNQLEGSFYAHELQVVDRDEEVFIIDRILRQKREGNRRMYFVKWKGYPDSFNSWVTESDVRELQDDENRNI